MNRRYRHDKRTLKGAQYRMLRDEPRTSAELPNPGSLTGRRLRDLVAKLKAPKCGSSGSGESRGRTKTVYYLWGDERRAIRKFIEVNPKFVDSCLTDDNSPLHVNWEDVLFELLIEEWEFRSRVEAETVAKEDTESGQEVIR